MCRSLVPKSWQAAMTGPDAPVGIVGAGPVGLACAARLASFGIGSVVLESEPALRPQGSKACLIQGDVLEILDKVGCAGQVAAEGVRWNVARTYVRGVEIVKTVYRIPVGYGPFINISQYRIEQILLDRVQSDAECRVLWSHRVSGLRQDGDGVLIEAQTPDGPRGYRFRYVVAADGVRSAMRDLAGAEWTGYSHGDLFLITDLQADVPFTRERHFHYDPPFNPGRQLVAHAQPDRIWRIDWQLAPDADIEAEKRNGELDRRIRRVIGDIPYEIKWLSTYRFHQRVVREFRAGRVFFAGDAAHALPPYGARGMNSGLQDADNLAWKLAYVLRGIAPENLLDSYHAERHAAALGNLRVTEATIQFMVPPSAWRRRMRQVILATSLVIPAVRQHVNSGTMAAPHIYTDSPIVAAAGRRPLTGMFAPDGLVRSDGRRLRLRTLFGHELVVLYSARGTADGGEFAARAAPRIAGLPAAITLLLPPGQAPPPGDGCFTPRLIYDDHPSLRADYPPGHWFLVRPDGHVAASGRASAATADSGLPELLARSVGGLVMNARPAAATQSRTR
jgi:3-(3-hydroxy-phenyl)propionate hydroxylase